jgi:hypothetical protein
MLHKTPFLAVVMVVLATTAVAQQLPDAGAKMVVPEKIKDFGEVAQGEILKADFTILNEGTETLEIRAVRPTCGCTVADYDREIPAGGEGIIAAELDTTDFKGPISKLINVVTSDPVDPSVRLVIKATVKPYVEVLPRAMVRFNAIQKEALRETLTVVADPDASDFRITGVESELPYVTANVRPLKGDERVANAAGDQYELAVELGPDAPVGPVSTEIVLETSHPKAERVPVKVYGVVRSLIHVTPTQLQFGAVDASARPARNLIVINNRDNGSVRVTGADVNDSAFETSVSTIEDGKRYQVTVAVKTDAAPGARDAVLTLKTSDADFPRVEIPVRASIR